MLRNRIGIVHAALVLFALLLVGRAGKVQLLERDAWARRAERQQVAADSLPAPRGAILDATGEVLAESRELVTLSVAPREVRDLRALRRALDKAGVAPAVARRATDRRRAWVDLPGTFLPSRVTGLVSLRGVHAKPAVERVYSSAEGIRRVVGRLDFRGQAADGIELALDSVLTGERGRTRLLRDNRGRVFSSPALEGEEPRPGATVVLTLHHALQDIAEHAIGRATAQTGASGGDIVVLDPNSGEILALASHRVGRQVSGVPALTDTYEPGSTLKPFVAARLLSLGRTRESEVIATYDGAYMAPGRRSPIRDVHRAASMTFADVMRHSSNVGMVRLAERLTPAEQYEALRDAGFGTATGVPFPSEASGRLPSPPRWSKTTPAALAMGYEIGVTPLQLANAYAAIANGGELLEPALVKEIRAADGTVLFRHRRRVVRRLMPEEVATRMRRLLASVVDSGTATDATLTTYSVGGKSGTARLSTGRSYEGGAYTASFAALFPADAPQLVVLIKLDRPQGVYYGGKAAAPVSKAVIEAALAASDAALDRADLARRARRVVRVAEDPGARTRTAARPVQVTAVAEASADSLADTTAAPAEDPALAPVLFRLASREAAEGSLPPTGSRPVPDVAGLPTRPAVRRLHDAGFRVRLERGLTGTLPAAGTTARVGSLVRLGVSR
jgi:cell division protein FtsI (penicillin-binding protein 3)